MQCDMKKYFNFVIFAVIITFLFIVGARLINRPVGENDEGIYATTFLLVSRGYRLYKDVFFSQPPGFFLAIYPLFHFFGKTIQAGRLAVLIWSFVGVSSLFLLLLNRKHIYFAVFAVMSLFAVPLFFYQTATLQADILAVVFTLLCFVAMNFFQQNRNYVWFFLSVFFGSLSFWTKFDLAAPGLLLIGLFLIGRKNSKRNQVFNLYLLAAIIFFALSITLFLFIDFPAFLVNVVQLRTQAAKVYFFSLNRFLDLFKQNLLLSYIVICSVYFSFVKKDQSFIYNLLRVWFFVSFVSLFFFRPLFLHHLVFIVVPSILIFVWNIESYLSKKLLAFLIFSLGLLLVIRSWNVPQTLASEELRKAIDFVNTHTKRGDFVVSDEASIGILSLRLPPPNLSDISQVRISSGNLSPVEFKKTLEIFKPKIIISWNGRLQSFPQFEGMVEKDYVVSAEFEKGKVIYLRRDSF